MEESSEYLEKPEEEKPVRLSLHLICKRHLPPDSQTWNQQQIIEALNKISHLRLDRERIGEIDSLELLGNRCTNLYLQSNRIERIENLECLKNLTFIHLANNLIKEIHNLQCLKKLLFLDLSDNQISAVEKGEIPQSVIILNLTGNPCTSYPHYKYQMLSDFPRLRQLDLNEISVADKRDAGLDVSSEEEEDSEEEVDDKAEGDKRSPVTGPGNKHNNQSESLQMIAAGIMQRSQQRTEETFREHKKHASQLDDLRITCNAPPSTRSSTSRSSRLEPTTDQAL